MPAMMNSELMALSPPDFCLDHWLRDQAFYERLRASPLNPMESGMVHDLLLDSVCRKQRGTWWSRARASLRIALGSHSRLQRTHHSILCASSPGSRVAQSHPRFRRHCVNGRLRTQGWSTVAVNARACANL